MKRVIGSVLVLGVLAIPQMVAAVSVSGILLYATDDFGDPYGETNFDNCGNVQTQLWRTVRRPDQVYHGLGVWAGLPPDSLRGRPLNAPNFMVEIPLVDGENDFTIVGDPSDITRGERANYQRYVLSLYFDGVVEYPGISVRFKPENPPDGGPWEPNAARTCRAYSLSLVPLADVQPQTSYDDGAVAVSVMAASFLAAEEFGIPHLDLVSPGLLAPSGREDFIGVLRILVEPAEGTAGGGGGPVRGPGPEGFGVLLGDGAGGPGLGVPAAPIVGGRGPAEQPRYEAPSREPRGQWRDARAATPAQEEAGPDTTPEPTAAAATPTPGSRTATPSVAARVTGSPTAAARTTPTPRSTSIGATPTPGKAEGTPAASAAPASPQPAATPTAPHAAKKTP